MASKKTSVSVEETEFGKDHGLIHEVIVTGRKIGAGREFWSRLAHNEDLFQQVRVLVCGSIKSDQDDPLKPLKQWELLYREAFGETHDFSGVQIPEKREGFNRLLIVAKGVTRNRVYDACAKQFTCWHYTDDLDTGVPTNDRELTETYAVWVRDRVEADEELKNLSAVEITKKGIKGITLLERMLYELKYFRETGKHLDINNVTLCSGSRDAGGYVPSACWRGGGFRIGWDHPRDAGPGLRSRAVSL